MTMIEANDLLIQVFVLVDDWYQSHGNRLRPQLSAPSGRFSESEMLTLVLVMDYFLIQANSSF